MGIRTLFHKISSLFFREEAHSSIDEFHETLPHSFSHPEYLVAALTHPSFSGENQYHFLSYERLEYLGDAVLEMVTSDYLFRAYPEASEGELTRRRAALVNRVSLAARARELGLPEYIRAQPVTDHPIEESESVLGDVMEAIIGAAYLDGGMGPATQVIRFLLPFPESDEGSATSHHTNYKGELIEYCHTHGIPDPVFKTLDKQGPDHSRIYRVAVSIRDTLLGKGEGPSKKKAGQIAAKHALTRLKNSPGFREKP